MAVAEEKGSTSGVQTFLELGWTGSHITFGSGYDLMNRSLRASALEPFQPKAESNALDYYSDIQTIDTQEELKAKIKADVEVHAPLEGAKIEVSAGYLNSVAISSKTMLQVIEEVIDQPPVRADPGTLQLSQKAKALLAEDNGLEKFRAHYGEYFVYGCRSKSSFTAVYNFEASSKEVLNEIKASVKLKSDVASAIANTNISISDNKSSVKVAISMHIKGFEDREEEKGKLVKMTEVESTFEKFQAGFKPKPYLALLCHYSAVDNRIPEPKSQFKFLGHTLGESFQRLYIMQSDLLSSPMVKAHDYATTVAQACDKLGSLDIGKSELIDAFVKEIDGCQQEVDKWFLRESLLTDAQKLTDNRLSDM
ncbi:MAG: hypothetical protein M1812_001509 [Candelaria pacifica]|nr:MAG: hypothetical protein M1812_001509 [Candelaria pacifica]